LRPILAAVLVRLLCEDSYPTLFCEEALPFAILLGGFDVDEELRLKWKDDRADVLMTGLKVLRFHRGLRYSSRPGPKPSTNSRHPGVFVFKG